MEDRTQNVDRWRQLLLHQEDCAIIDQGTKAQIEATDATQASLPSVSSDASSQPVFEVTAEGKPFSASVALELWQFREVLWAFIVRQVKVRYKQAAVGIGWAILQPIASSVLFAIFLGRLAHVSSEGAPYLLFALAGMVAWTFFATAVGNAMESIILDQAMVRKVYFPREVLPLASVAAALVDLAPALLTLVVAALLFGVTPALAWLLMPLPIVILVISAAALGIGLSALNVYYRDVRHALPFVLQIGLFASPVVYSVSLIPNQFRVLYTIANPVAAAIDGIRQIIIHGHQPVATTTLGALAWSMLLFVGAYYMFKRLERGFADRL